MAHSWHWHGTALPGVILLAGCVAPSAPPPPPPAAPTYSAIGLESVIGRTVSDLEAHLGKPLLDTQEGNARRLQFASSICILDAYLYPSGKGGEAVVTYVDARMPDGRDIDRASCVAALMLQPQTP